MPNMLTPVAAPANLVTAYFDGVAAGQPITVPGVLASDVLISVVPATGGLPVTYFSVTGPNTLTNNFTSTVGLSYRALIWRQS